MADLHQLKLIESWRNRILFAFALLGILSQSASAQVNSAAYKNAYAQINGYLENLETCVLAIENNSLVPFEGSDLLREVPVRGTDEVIEVFSSQNQLQDFWVFYHDGEAETVFCMIKPKQALSNEETGLIEEWHGRQIRLQVMAQGFTAYTGVNHDRLYHRGAYKCVGDALQYRGMTLTSGNRFSYVVSNLLNGVDQAETCGTQTSMLMEN